MAISSKTRRPRIKTHQVLLVDLTMVALMTELKIYQVVQR